MKRKKLQKTILSMVLTLAMTLGAMSGTGLMTFAQEGGAITRSYGSYDFTKVSNPTAGQKQADGINTNDVTGFSANRLNSYAWAVASRGDYIYIGTNRTLFGSAVNAVAEDVQKQNPNLSDKVLGMIVKLVTGGDVPVNLAEEEYIPQIIKFDVKNETSEVIYQPGTAVGEDGCLYYTDRDGAIVPNADVDSEAASFRSVIEYKGNLYFGSLGTNMLQLVRIDEEDHASVVFQTLGLFSSLRACSVYDAGDGETIYFGGQDATNADWLEYIQTHEEQPLPIVIRYLDPETAGSNAENWEGLIADFNDFGKYAYATVYARGGGNVWDLCSYNGKLYLILAYDGGWAMFRGEKGGAHPNKYGWTWTEIVGDNGTYPLAMNEEVADLNEQYRVDYGCGEYGTPAMSGSGLLESTATPYVYKGKMYIGSFDNATMIQSQTVIKVLTKLQYMMKAKETGNRGPTLTQLFAPIYEVLAHPQHVWVMDENERITPVESANALLDGTTNDYVWRFIEYNGKLYTGTFDSSTSYNYFLGYIKNTFLTAVKKNLDEMPEYVQQLMNGSFSDTLKALLRKAGNKSGLMGSSSGTIDAESANAAIAASSSAEAFLDGDDNEERLLYNLEELKDAWEETTNRITSKPRMSMASANGTQEDAESLNKAGDMIEWLLEFFEGLEYLVKARKLVAQAESGFDIFVTEDGEIWEKVVGDGLSDIYNYGARTFTILNDELYVGTANPYYGAQLWKVSGEGSRAEPVVTREPAAANSLKYNGKKQKLVTEGAVQGGTIRYALQANGKTSAWSETVPTAVNAGTYKVLWDVAGDRTHKDAPGGTITVSIGKAAATITVKTASKTYKASSVRKKARSFKIGASASSKAKLSYKVVKYKNKASKKYLRFLTKSGKVKVKKGTPRGTYKVKVKITAPATANYMKKESTKTLTVKVK